MGKKKQYDIAGIHFNSQKELKEYIKKIKGNKQKEVINEEYEFMKAWFEWSQPDNCIPEIVRIYVAECWGQPQYTNLHFRVVRQNNSDEELAWWPFTSKTSLFSLACRRSVDFQIEEVKEGKQNVQVHHEKPYFATLVKWFIEKYDIDIKKVEYREVDIGRNYIAKVFKDDWTAERFRQFHQKHANLKVVDKDEHNQIHFAPWIIKNS